MKSYLKPHLIEFVKIGKLEEGHISIVENLKHIPFSVNRVFWTYSIPETATRGGHAHYKTEQVLIVVKGKISVKTEMRNGDQNTFLLDTPSKGVYMPPDAWHTIQYYDDAVQLVLASTAYDEKDYIRDYNEFKRNG